MSNSIWQSSAYLDNYEWLVKSLDPLDARTQAFASLKITGEQLTTLAGAAGGPMRQSEMLLDFLSQREDSFPCLVAIVSAQEHPDVAERLRQALFPPTSRQSPQHHAGTTAALVDPQLALPADHTLLHQAQPELLRDQPLPAQDPIEPEPKRQPPDVYPIPNPVNGEVVAEAANPAPVARNPARDRAARLSSDTGIESDGEESIIKKMKVLVIREKYSPIDVNILRATLKERFKVNVKATCIPEDPGIRAAYLDNGDDAQKEYYERDMATVEVVVRVDDLTPEAARRELAQSIKATLHACGIELVITNIGDTRL